MKTRTHDTAAFTIFYIKRSVAAPGRQDSTYSESEDYRPKIPYHIKISYGYELIFPMPPSQAWFEDVVQDLREFQYLPQNWDSYGAPQIKASTIAAAIEVLYKVIQNDTPKPYVFPTPDGGVQFEWHTETIDLEIEILDSTTIIVLFTDPEEKDHEWEAHPNDISRIIDCIKMLK